MIAFEIKRNGKLVCIAGAEDLSGLTMFIGASGKLGAKTVFKGLTDEEVPLDLYYFVGGSTSRRDPKKDMHLNWKSVSRLRVGDLLEVRIVEVQKADRPNPRNPERKPCGVLPDIGKLHRQNSPPEGAAVTSG